MQTFREIGASLDAAHENVAAVLHCLKVVPSEGFKLRLDYTLPHNVAEGQTRDISVLTGMQPLMDMMAKIIREQELDFEHLMAQAVDRIIREANLDHAGFVGVMNRVRNAYGAAPLVSAEQETADMINAAVEAAQQKWSEEEQVRLGDRVRQAIEADREARAAADQQAEPPPPRGTAKRRT